MIKVKNANHFRQLIISNKLNARHDYSHISNMAGLFRDNAYIKSIPKIDLSHVRELKGMFTRCVNLKAIPSLGISTEANISGMIDGCVNLESIDIADFVEYRFENSKLPKLRTIFPELFI